MQIRAVTTYSIVHSIKVARVPTFVTHFTFAVEIVTIKRTNIKIATTKEKLSQKSKDFTKQNSN